MFLLQINAILISSHFSKYYNSCCSFQRKLTVSCTVKTKIYLLIYINNERLFSSLTKESLVVFDFIEGKNY